MTTDRDRLAALLHDIADVCGNNEFGCEGPLSPEHDTQALRLIAAGVGFRDEPRLVLAADLPAFAYPDLDVERLARALVTVQAWHPHLVLAAAAAIAAAYQEDVR